jgi:hypothetical protein
MAPATFFQPDPFDGVLGPSLAGKRPNTEQNFNLYFNFLPIKADPLCAFLLASAC